MALRTLLVLASLALACEARRRMPATILVGGATSFGSSTPAPGSGLAGKLFNGPCSLPAGQTYQSVGSGTGIKNFLSGTYVIALSDVPLDAGQDKTVPTRLTFPLALAKYTFFVNGKADFSVTLSAKDSYSAFVSGKTSVAGFTSVTPWSRSESSGTTSVFKRYWLKTGNSVPLPITTTPFPSTWLTSKYTKPGSGDVCLAVAGSATPAVTYSQVGICNQVAPGKTGEVMLISKAGTPVKVSQSNGNQAIPLPLPLRTATYSGVPDQMLLRTGAATPPIASFIYAIVRSNSATLGTLGKSAKAMMTCINGKVNSFADALNFNQLSSSIIGDNSKAITKIA